MTKQAYNLRRIVLESVDIDSDIGYIFTAHQRSWGKVKFSQVSVSPQGGAGIPGPMFLPGGGYPWSHIPSQGGYPWPQVSSWGGYPWSHVSAGGGQPPPLHTPILRHTHPTPLVLTPSGGHQSGWYTSYWNAFLLKLKTKNWVDGGYLYEVETKVPPAIKHLKQECIRVGCVPPAVYRTGGSRWQRSPPDKDPLWTESQTGVKTFPSCNFVCGR